MNLEFNYWWDKSFTVEVYTDFQSSFFDDFIGKT